ncbi:protein Vhl [Drosophila grimshawi]|uniref:GH19949 n=1 Tax=Drosophila grimshawi TaxID=7222 RepID=B4J8H7_DROGR|nr:protein Vhl [Drosophila grimshawi]EDW02336.1 GH19949 [Drosophila grimshawi]
MELRIARSNYNWNDHPAGQPQVEEEVYVQFVNTTNHTVNLFWTSDINAEYIQYTLKPKHKVPVNTFNTHIWFFREYYTGEHMHVRRKRLFYPVRIRIPRNPQQPEELRDVRSEILIHLPLRTLKEMCLCWIAKRLNRKLAKEPRQYIDGYMIPTTLKEELLAKLTTIEAYTQEFRRQGVMNQLRRDSANSRP